MKILNKIHKQHKKCPGSFLKNQTIESAYIHMAVITPTAIVIISTLMLMVLKRIRLWISAIIFMPRASMTIRRKKDCDEFLLFLRERVNSMDHLRAKNQWGQRFSAITSQAGWEETWVKARSIEQCAQNRWISEDRNHQWIKQSIQIQSDWSNASECMF